MNTPADDDPDFKLEGEDKPPVKNGLLCFFNDTRECGSDCMAFTPEPAESPSLSLQQCNCSLIVSAERVGRYMSGLVQLIKKGQEKSARAAADQARLTQFPPVPDPSGKA